MASEDSPFQTEANEQELLPRARKRHYQNAFVVQAVRSYLFLSFGMGLVALVLPIALVGLGGYQGHYSISYFYHVVPGPTRDILVGSLWAIGVFLFLFQGLSPVENWLLNL